MKPSIRLIPARPLRGESHITDLLLRISAPHLPQGDVPPLDLVLALDTSGSMGGLPLDLARRAAEQVFQQRGNAHLALVHFSSTARVAAPLQAWTGDEGFLTALRGLRAGGSTALHAGWELAASLLTAPLGHRPQVPHRLQRVLLLTDGRANVGLRHPRDLSAAIRAGLAQGVSTSTVGLGRQYNELLLEALAGEGDGTYHYAESPEQLSGLFLSELESLKNTFGRLVSLGIEGVEVLDVWNDLPKLSNGRLALPPLQSGRDAELLIRVRAKAGDTVRLRLAWHDAAGQRHAERTEFVLPAAVEGQETAEHPEVVRLRGQLELARQQRQIAQLTDRGRVEDALVRLGEARGRLEGLIVAGIDVQEDLAKLDQLQDRLRRGDRQAASKAARSQAYLMSTGREKK